MEQNKKRTPNDRPNMLISALIGGGVSLSVMLLTAFVFPFVALKFNNPNALSAPMAYITVFLGAMVGSFVSAKRNGDMMLGSGMLSGAFMLLPMALVSLIIPGDMSFLSALAAIAVIALASFLGAFAVMKLGTNRKRNMKKAMKRR